MQSCVRGQLLPAATGQDGDLAGADAAVLWRIAGAIPCPALWPRLPLTSGAGQSRGTGSGCCSAQGGRTPQSAVRGAPAPVPHVSQGLGEAEASLVPAMGAQVWARPLRAQCRVAA